MDAKLSIPIPDGDTLVALLKIWRDFVDYGTVPQRVHFEEMAPGRYGRIEIPVDQSHQAQIFITTSADRRRQALSLVHEYLHLYYHPNQPNHSGLHSLAWILHATVFPNTRNT